MTTKVLRSPWPLLLCAAVFSGCTQKAPESATSTGTSGAPGASGGKRYKVGFANLTEDNGLTLLNVSSDYQEIARGVVLLLAVALDQLRLRLGNR